jgi:hypothetical protein
VFNLDAGALTKIEAEVEGELKEIYQYLLALITGLQKQGIDTGGGTLVRLRSSQSRRRNTRWRRGGWASSRQQWNADRWKHDWLSQPRNAIGEWIPGRLPYPVTTVSHLSRRVRRQRRARRRYRAAHGQKNGAIMSSWSK